METSSSTLSNNTSITMEKPAKTEPEPNTLRLSETEALLVGAIGGTIETCLQMPLITWKICIQEGRAYPTVLREWYRGVFINASGVSPITAVQCFANQLFQTVLLQMHGKGYNLTDVERISCSAGAGAVSALIYGPVDLLVIQQQKMKLALGLAFNAIRNEYGALRIYRGLGSTVIRESIYTMGYLGIAPVIQDRLLNSSNIFLREHIIFTSAISAMMGGTIAALITHPVDTSKTCIQSDLKGNKYPNLIKTTIDLYQNGGISVLYKGVIARTLRLCGACFVITQTRMAMLQFKKYRLGIQD